MSSPKPVPPKPLDPTILMLYDSRRGLSEGREHERVLACYPYDLDINEQTVMTGLAHAQRSFLQGEMHSEGPVTVLTMKDRTWIIQEIEPSIALLLVVNRTLWGHRDGPKDNILREYTSLAATFLQGTLGSIQDLLSTDATGTEVRLLASPVLGAAVLAFEDVDGPLGRAFLSSPLAECSYPRVLPWSDRSKNLCQLLRQELITWSGSRLRRRVFGDGSTRFQGGDLSAQVVIIYTGRGKNGKEPATNYLVESSLGARDTQLVYWLGVQALCGAKDLEPVGTARPLQRDEGRSDTAPSSRGRMRTRALFDDPAGGASSSSSASWFATALSKAMPWGGGSRKDARARHPSGSAGGFSSGFFRNSGSSSAGSPRSLSGLFEWSGGGGGATPHHIRTTSSGATFPSPGGSLLDMNVAAARIGSFLTTASEPPGGNALTPRTLPGAEGGGAAAHPGYAYEGSYRNSRLGLHLRGNGAGGDAGWSSPPPTAAATAAAPLSAAAYRAPEPTALFSAEGSYHGGTFTWANCYASVAISAQLRREFQEDDIDAPSTSGSSASPQARADASGLPTAVHRHPRHSRQPSTCTPLEADYWRSFTCDVEVPFSGSQSGEDPHPEPNQLQLVAYFPKTESFRNQFGGRLCTVHLEGSGGLCALVPVRTGPLLFLVAVPVKRLDASVEAMLQQQCLLRGRGNEAVAATSAAPPPLPPLPPLNVSPAADPQYRTLARERALEVVAGICGDVLLKVADQLAPAAANDASEVKEGDLAGIRFLARNCELRQCMATPERRLLLMPAEAAETMERLRAALYETGAGLPEEPLPQVEPEGSPRAARAVGIRTDQLQDGGNGGSSTSPMRPPGARDGADPSSWSSLALTFSRSLGVVLAPGPPRPSLEGARDPGALLPTLAEDFAAAGPEAMFRSASCRSLFEEDDARRGLPNGVREAIVRAADGSWICALEKFADANGRADREAPRSPGDPLHAGRKVQLFLVVSRKETKDGARSQLYTLASKLDI